MSMMRIAVAGSGGLARLIAHYIDEETSHQVVILSRSRQPALSAKGFQVVVIDYNDEDEMVFALRGTDTVISTVTGLPQITLIRASVRARCRRFAPAEFEGLPRLRNSASPLDRHRSDAQRLLTACSGKIEWTNFICGIFYERFQPGGLSSMLIGGTSSFANEGDYIMDVRKMTAQVPALDSQGQPTAAICMTSVQDVARFVTKAVDLPQWPRELRMCGERIAVHHLVAAVEHMKRERFGREMHSAATLRAALAVAAVQQDRHRAIKLHALIATVEGKYDFSQPTLNDMFRGVRTIRFSEWFRRKWGLE